MDFDQTREDSFGGAIQAVIANDLRKLQDLSRKGKSMRICDNRGLTPIHHAVRLGHIDCIEWLICQGKRSIFQTFWKLHCVTKSLFFELETSNFGYLLIF